MGQGLLNICLSLHALGEAVSYFSQPASLGVLESQSSLKTLLGRRAYLIKLSLFKAQVDYVGKFAGNFLSHNKVSGKLLRNSWISRHYVQRNFEHLSNFNSPLSCEPSKAEYLHRTFAKIGDSLFPNKAPHLIPKKKQLS